MVLFNFKLAFDPSFGAFDIPVLQVEVGDTLNLFEILKDSIMDKKIRRRIDSYTEECVVQVFPLSNPNRPPAFISNKRMLRVEFEFVTPLSIVPAQRVFVLKNDEIRVMELDPRTTYEILISSRDTFLQRPDMFRIIDLEAGDEFNFIFIQNNLLIKSGFFYNLRDAFENIDTSTGIALILGDNVFEPIDPTGITSDSESLKLVDSEERIPILNFMAFQLGRTDGTEIILSDLAIPVSFYSKIQGEGIKETARLASYIRSLNGVYNAAKQSFFAPIINVCQSSGSGKSKIAVELMDSFPSMYVVFRDELDTGFPEKSLLSSVFMLSEQYSKIPDDSSFARLARSSIVGSYLLLLCCILKNYSDNVARLKRNNVSSKNIIQQLSKQFNGESGNEENTFIFENYSIEVKRSDDSMRLAILNCQNYLKNIKRALADLNSPFLFILDEASLLAAKPNSKRRDRFRLLRRAFSLIGSGCDVMVLTLGTSSDIIDLNPEVTSDSHRQLAGEHLFHPFVLSNNWDLFLDSQKFKDIKISQKVLLSGRMIIALFSLGRPIWSSISFNSVVETALTKLKNGLIKTGEPFLASWMIRTGITSHPTHSVTRKLVKSLMATVLSISPDLGSIYIYYPSEPTLAMAARELLSFPEARRIDYYLELEKFVQLRAIDTGRFSEIISADFCLTAVDKADVSVCDWRNVDDLPGFSSNNKFVLENVIDSAKCSPQYKLEEVADNFSSDVLAKYYRIVTVGSFLQSLYGKDLFEEMKPFLPAPTLNGLVNASHFVQIGRNYLPKSEYFNTPFPMERFACADARYANEAYPCNVITHELLETGLLRQSGFIMPLNYYGIDLIIPVCLEGNVLTFIGIQVKKGTCSNVKLAVSKGAASNHFVKCPAHQNCVNANCQTRIPDDSFRTICENQIMLLFCLDKNEIRERQSFSIKSFSRIPNDLVTKITTSLKRTKIESEHNNESEFYDASSIIGSETEEIEQSFNELAIETAGLDIQMTVFPPVDTGADITAPTDSSATPLENILSVESSNDISIHQYFHSMLPVEYEHICPLGTTITAMKPQKIQKPPENISRNAEVPTSQSADETESEESKCRFDPDAMVVSNFNGITDVYLMLKKDRDVSGLTHRITCIKSNHLSAFKSLLGAQVLEVATRIVHYDECFFSGIDRSYIKDTFDAFVSRNNDGRMPVADNFLREKLGFNLIPRELRDYSTLSSGEILDANTRTLSNTF